MVQNTSNAVGDDCSESICESDADESEMDGMLCPHCRPDCSLSYAALSPVMPLYPLIHARLLLVPLTSATAQATSNTTCTTFQIQRLANVRYNTD